MRNALLSFLALQLMLAPSAAIAQAARPVEIPDAIACAKCAVTVRTLATIGDQIGDGAILTVPLQVSVDGLNRYWVSAIRVPPMVYDSTGKFLRLAGRLGQGPGEFRGSTTMHLLAPDTILMTDIVQLRATALSNDFRVLRSFPLPDLARYESLGRNLIASGFLGTAASASFPLHLIQISGNTGVPTKSFAPDSVLKNERDYSLYQWILGPGRNGTVWSSDLDQYRVVQWSSTGVPLATLTRKPAWFKVKSSTYAGGPNQAPYPKMSAVAQDAEGLLWVAATAAAPTWKDGWIGVPLTGELRAADGPDYTKLYQTEIEVLDPAKNQVVARMQIKEIIISFLPGRRAALYVEDAQGVPRVKIVGFDLTR